MLSSLSCVHTTIPGEGFWNIFQAGQGIFTGYFWVVLELWRSAWTLMFAGKNNVVYMKNISKHQQTLMFLQLWLCVFPLPWLCVVFASLAYLVSFFIDLIAEFSLSNGLVQATKQAVWTPFRAAASLSVCQFAPLSCYLILSSFLDTARGC